MLKAALYARYSTDNQRRTSIDDQMRQGRARAALEAVGVDAENLYSDDETSGSVPIESRPGSSRLMRDAAAGRFQVLIIEALDRFSRNLVDQERMVRRLEHRGVRILAYADGYDSSQDGREFLRQVRGSFNEQLLRDIGKKTHRGLGGQVERGFHAGGRSYGYRSEIAGVDGKGEPIGHRLLTDEDEAGHVRWIFARYAEGWSCQRIASDLNRRGVPAPRGGTWAVSALYGSPAKGSGVINNELYIGNYVWNRSKWTKDPDTGKRQRGDRPREEWKVVSRPELAIVEPGIWRQVRARMDRPRLAGGRRGKGAQPRSLFGGLMTCGKCGGAVVAVNERTYGCAARKDRGVHVCTGVLVHRQQLDARLLSLVRDELLSPEAIAAVQANVVRILGATKKQRDGAEARTRSRLAELEREIGHMVDAVASFGPSEALKARLQAAEKERAALAESKARAPAPAAIPGIVAAYRRMVADLQKALERDVLRARDLLQGALGAIKLVPEGKAVYAEIETGAERLLMAAGANLSLEVVAGTCSVTRRRIRVR
jgi:DNA invertase Pin-like site-specific DNA recombinase